jgi:DnaJ family protein B protein 4
MKFPGEGHAHFSAHKSALTIKLIQTPHKLFRRNFNDLIYTHKVSFLDSLLSSPIIFTNIDGEKIEVSVDSVIGPNTQKVIPGRGMPILNDDPLGPIKKSYRRGNLIIVFDIEFPQQLSED